MSQSINDVMTVITRDLGLQDYLTCWRAMQSFTAQRDEKTLDEIWLLQHPAVFTQGQNGKPEHILHPGDIPIVPVDRGGQVTYHGPGQCIAYILIDIRRKKINVRELVTALEKSVIQLLNTDHISAYAKPEAPGIYVNHQKICSLGLRIRRGCSYHGLALNVDMNLEPFSRINPCGFAKLEMTQIADYHTGKNFFDYQTQLTQYLMQNLGYTTQLVETGNPYGSPSQTTR